MRRLDLVVWVGAFCCIASCKANDSAFPPAPSAPASSNPPAVDPPKPLAQSAPAAPAPDPGEAIATAPAPREVPGEANAQLNPSTDSDAAEKPRPLRRCFDGDATW